MYYDKALVLLLNMTLRREASKLACIICAKENC